ncbi:MAG: hypothetical protein F4Y06_03580 [Rhodospirillales bacterium]|nr:hypothetical protein [Rhodospirillales bacterium]MYE18989.1 hypothetical protein [Rhodospirillales bacterium]
MKKLSTPARLAAQITIVLLPSYAVAYFTGEMVWTIPTLAAALVVATTLAGRADVSRNIDEGDIGTDGGADGSV